MHSVTGITLVGFRLGVIALGLYWVAIFCGTHLPASSVSGPKVNDKLLHFAAFFVLSGFCCYVTNSPRGNGLATLRRFMAIAVVLACYAAADEWTQSFSPGRTCDPMDFLADCAGVVAAILIYVAARALLPSFPATRPQA